MVDVWEDDYYLRVLPAGGDELVLLRVENRGTIDEPDVQISVQHGDEASASGAGVVQIVRMILGLDIDPEPIRVLGEAESKLRLTAMALRGMRPPRFPTLFEAFANVVPFQQVSLEAGLAITGRLVERFGRCVEVDGRSFHAFPTPGAVAESRLPTLRACGLSARKAESLRGIARSIASGELNGETIASMSTLDALRRLLELPGIGPWSAGLVLLRGLGRLDVFPSGDVGAERGLRSLLHLGPRAAFGRAVERFGDLRGYVYFYSLGSSLLAKGLIHPAPPAPRGRGSPAPRPRRSRAGA
ncbi:DNA-3-methyladenine glycosylase II [Labilithrix luteola]|uniref:DNA-3-methyladenine glycosylase II n=1 Tax=Labilithrix luteola TaxID=1391654 RepID=A0A0K1Q720_9BACT|nr:DNA-3-methyladenine glycosylase [Labilithrix luteola]AKV01452.1 DNA-3-methyladenine glycosylase II [Labilithrix luteola]